MPNPSDPVFACLQIETVCPVGQTDTGERCYRVTINTPGKWSVGDTIVIKLQEVGTNCRLFGWDRSGITSADVEVWTSNRVPVSCTVANLGQITATVTLSESAPDGDTLTFGYRTGVPGSYVALVQDRGNADLAACTNSSFL